MDDSTARTEPQPRLTPGTVVAKGRYKIVAELGEGGMAIVYRARDALAGNVEVALKVVSGEADRDEAEARYQNEARLGAALAGQPQIVRPLDLGRLDGPEGFAGRMYLVTELVRGMPLDRVTEDHPLGLPLLRTVHIALDVAQALEALHQAGIVHRDVKPANVVLTSVEGQEHAKLLDFGVAFATGDGHAEQSPKLTRMGAVPGTPTYMSPQQALQQRTMPHFDIYAFGATIYEMLSGAAPFSKLGPDAILAQKCDPEAHPRRLDKLCEGVPDALVELVHRCLRYAPEDRPTAGALVEELRDVLAGVRASDAPSWKPTRNPDTPFGSVIAKGARPAGRATLAEVRAQGIALPHLQATQDDELPADPADLPASPSPLDGVPIPIHTPDPDAPVKVPPRGATVPTPWAGPIPPLPPPPAPAPRPSPAQARPRRILGLAAIALVFGIGSMIASVLVLRSLGLGSRASRAQPDLNTATDSAANRHPKQIRQASAKPILSGPGKSAATAEPSPPRAAVDRPLPTLPSEDPLAQPTDPLAQPTDPLDASAAAQRQLHPESQPRADSDSKAPTPTGSSSPTPKHPVAVPPSTEAPAKPATKAAPPLNCVQKRDRARRAAGRKNWNRVLKYSRDAACWALHPEDRRRVRVQAHRGLGNHARCAREGALSKDPVVQRWSQDCLRKMTK